MPEQQELRVTPADAGERLDAYLARRLRLARGYAERLIARGLVSASGRRLRKGSTLAGDEVLTMGAFRHPSEGIQADPHLELEVLYEQGGLVAVNKPAGIPTHPLDYDELGTLANAIVGRFPEARSIGFGGLEPGLLHRLDTQTSGVVVFAQSTAAWEHARRTFEDRSARKLYLARVHGQLRGSHELHLRLVNRGARMRVVEQGGLPAHSLIRALDVRTADTLVEIDLRTGVRHQIRASLARLGHPIIGDTLYGSSSDRGRHLLHAWRIQIGQFAALAPIPETFEL